MKGHGLYPDINTPAHWRMRAQEMRTVTQEASDPVVKEMMLRLAAEFDRVAEHAEADEPSSVLAADGPGDI